MLSWVDKDVHIKQILLIHKISGAFKETKNSYSLRSGAPFIVIYTGTLKFFYREFSIKILISKGDLFFFIPYK